MNRALMPLLSAIRIAATRGLAALALGALACVPARAVCQFSWLTFVPPDIAYALTAPNLYHQFSPNTPYWIAYGALSSDPGADWDVAIYDDAFWSPCAEPECFCSRIANSVRGAGSTDFVIGDFNHNPYGSYWAWIRCYQGSCTLSPAGRETWRSGNLVSVNTAPITVDLNAGGVDGRPVLTTYDVYLNSGTRYYFSFQATGDRETKLLLFANLGGGTYWVGRNAAQFETNQCMTSYVAPVTGYYGIVVVNDRLTSNPATYTLGVSTSVPCNCPTVLASGVPQILPASPGDARDVVVQPHQFWTAVGARSTADWDLTVGDTPSSAPGLGCPTNTLSWSNLLAPTTDVLAGDYNWSPSDMPQDTVAVRVSMFGGSANATVQMDGGTDIILDNGAKQTGTLYADDVLRIWDVMLQKDTTYTFSLQTCCANQKLLLFGNSIHDVLWQGRPSAMLQTSTTATFTPSFSGFYGAVVVKEDANVGGYTLKYGHCSSPTPLVARTPITQNRAMYCTFDQPANQWGAIGVWGAPVDWDIQQYDQASGSAWPDCFGTPGALSAASNAMDFIVGDFHHTPAGTYYARSYQYTDGATAYGLTDWDSGSGELVVNDPPLTVTLPVENVRHLWSYQVHLVGGLPYTFEFERIGAADTHMMLFMNPTNGTYWAPRSAALFSVTQDQPWIPAQTGWYGVVVAMDNWDTGRFILRVTSPVLDAENAARPVRDALTGLSPNPARGPLRVGFDLAAAAEPVFELLDAQGRVVTRRSQGAFATGHWELPLAAEDDRGHALAPGLYFVRMRVGGRAVETRKLVLSP